MSATIPIAKGTASVDSAGGAEGATAARTEALELSIWCGHEMVQEESSQARGTEKLGTWGLVRTQEK
jgi:hypothetical protein